MGGIYKWIRYSIVESAEIQIGGLTIDTLDSNWLDIYNELFDQRSDTLIGKFNTDITFKKIIQLKNYIYHYHFGFLKIVVVHYH